MRGLCSWACSCQPTLPQFRQGAPVSVYVPFIHGRFRKLRLARNICVKVVAVRLDGVPRESSNARCQYTVGLAPLLRIMDRVNTVTKICYYPSCLSRVPIVCRRCAHSFHLSVERDVRSKIYIYIYTHIHTHTRTHVRRVHASHEGKERKEERARTRTEGRERDRTRSR